MKTRNYVKYFAWLLTPLLIFACSGEQLGEAGDSSPTDEDAIVEAVDVSYDDTRALNLDLSSFSLSVYNQKTKVFLADKILFTKAISGSGFTGAKTWRMANAEMKAIAVSPSMDDLSAIVVDADNHYFEYEVPDVPEGTMYKIGANLSFTKASAGNKLSLKFVNALALLTVRVRNELKLEDKDGNEFDVKVYVKGITIHNLYSKGRFTFTSATNGKWTAIDGYYSNYSQDLATAVELSATTYTDVANGAFVLLPQAPDQRAWTGTGSISDADANHQVYIELRCSMTAERNGNTVYIWGGANSYPSVYLPYVKKYCPKSWNTINKQGVYNLRFIKSEVLDTDGKPIEPQTEEEGDSFENAVFIEVAPTDTSDDDNVDDWEDMNLAPYDVTI
ncbi:hypothetical protein SAMN06298211_11311 [Prevotellaceae bacterium MN60]|nr:hypothetical protein SAMN06298211_11311 [Prevotellaceae bacterium MN60]